jgi:hypothetical protein
MIKLWKKVRKTRRDIIKQNVLSGKEHKSHNNKKLIPSRRQCLVPNVNVIRNLVINSLDMYSNNIMISNLILNNRRIWGQTKSFFSLLNKSSHMKQSINSRKCVTNGSTFNLFTAVKRFIFIVWYNSFRINFFQIHIQV